MAIEKPRLPVVFVGHGNPMNAIDDNRFTRGFRELGRAVTRPKAILCVSAHWFVDQTLVTSEPKPRTIHDFGGFPKELYEIEYPAPGNPSLAAVLQQRLPAVKASEQWGLDHGTWTVLRHMFPGADIPVIQLSINHGLSGVQHIEIGQGLRQLRDEGVLIVASGNLVHNLRHAFAAMRSGEKTVAPWAERYDDVIKKALLERDAEYLANAWTGSEGELAHPVPDHYFPLLYAFGASDERDAVSFPIEGFDLSSISMRTVLFS